LRKKSKKQRSLNFQRITQLLPLADLRIIKRERSDLKEKSGMWMLI
jgi:hypothetical protein